jgi:PAP2 superfamily protein
VSGSDLGHSPAVAATTLGAATLLGFASAWLLLGSAERRIKAIRRIRGSPDRGTLVAGGAIASAGVAGAFLLLDVILNHHQVQRFDHHLHNVFRQRRTSESRKIVELTTSIGSIWAVGPIAAAAVYGFWRRGDERGAIAIVWNVIGSALLGEVLKNLIQRERPPEGKEDEDAYSFPSGHTLMSASLFALLAYLLLTDQKLGASRFAGAAALLLLIPWVAFSRIYLGMHWASDTIGGVALAAAWDAVLITFLRAE